MSLHIIVIIIACYCYCSLCPWRFRCSITVGGDTLTAAMDIHIIPWPWRR